MARVLKLKLSTLNTYYILRNTIPICFIVFYCNFKMHPFSCYLGKSEAAYPDDLVHEDSALAGHHRKGVEVDILNLVTLLTSV